MSKENLFKLIRKEETILWIGAGFSMYAGFPNGNRLKDILLESLSSEEKDQIDSNLQLMDFAEEFFRLKNGNKSALINILKETYLDLEPSSTLYHDKLSKIPHFKSIITTNYDKLIENSYGNRSEIIISSSGISNIQKNKTQIFKVHGDLAEPSSIILTKSDYNNFFGQNKENDLYWTVIKEKLSTNNILFIGYGLEDSNTSVILKKITDTLQSYKKEWFLVAPNLSKSKINDLVRNGITYIDSTGEQVIEELEENLKENITSDFDKGVVSADTFRKYLSFNNLKTEIRSEKKSYKLNSLKASNGKTTGKITFSVNGNVTDLKSLDSFINGKSIGKFKIPEDQLIDVSVWIGGIKMPDTEKFSLELESTPSYSSLIDIKFEDGFELNDISIKVYRIESEIEIHAELKNASIIIKVDLLSTQTSKVEFIHHEICRRVKEEIELFSFLERFSSHQKFTIFTPFGESFSHIPSGIPEFHNLSQAFLDYFQNLNLIESNYNIRFNDVGFVTITNDVTTVVNTIVAKIRKEKEFFSWKKELQSELVITSEVPLEAILHSISDSSIVIMDNQEKEVQIHGHTINLGFKITEILEPYLLNLDEIIEGKTVKAIIKSRINKIAVSYTDKKIDF